MAIFQRSRTKAIQKTLAGIGWEYRYDKRPFLLIGAALVGGVLGGWLYLKRRQFLNEAGSSAGTSDWLDLAELEMRAYQPSEQLPQSEGVPTQEELAPTGS